MDRAEGAAAEHAARANAGRSLLGFLRRLLPYLRPHAGALALAGALLAFSSAVSLAGPLLLKRVVDTDIPAKSVSGLALSAAVYVLAIGALMATTWLHRVLLERIGQSAMAELRTDLLERIVSLPLAFFDGQPSGKLITRVQGDIDNLRQVFTSAFLAFAGDLLLFVGMISVMLAHDVRLTLVSLAILPIVAVGFAIFQRVAGPRFDAQRARAADVNAFLAEHLRLLPVLQAFDRTAWSLARARALNEEKLATDVRAERAVIVFWNSIFMTESLVIAGVLIASAPRLSRDELTVGTLVLFLGYARRFFEPLHRVSDQLNMFEKARASAARILALLDAAPEPRTLAEPTAAVAPPGPRGTLRFDDVWFSYREGSSDESFALRGVSFEARAGERLALVGPTGHGKSTVLSLLLRFYVAQRGRVLVDGEDVRAVPLEQLRRRFGLVLQDTRLFPGTLAENVVLEPPADGRAADDVAREAFARIGALDLIERREGGVGARVGEGGAGLSHGERQLVALARAVARDPEILLLDEATASVDPATEAVLARALEAVCAGRTSIVVAHRLATVRRADRLLVVENGRVVEEGRREELLARGGRYAALERREAESALAPVAAEASP